MTTNAIDLLRQDHKKVKELFAQLAETTSRASKTRSKLVSQIGEELRIHSEIEEKVFYPAFREAGKKAEEIMFHEATEEHRAVNQQVLPDLESSDVDSEAFTGQAKALREMVEHHVQEEEDELFPKAQELLDDKKLEELGAQIMEMKKKLAVH